MVSIKFENLKSYNIDLLVIPVFSNADVHFKEITISLIKLAKSITGFDGKEKEIVSLNYPLNLKIRKVVFIGLGKIEKIEVNDLRCFAGIATKFSIDSKIKHLTCVLPDSDSINRIKSEEIFTSLLEGFLLNNYHFDMFKDIKKNLLTNITLISLNKKYIGFSSLISKIESICKSTILARNWVNMPSNYKKPEQIASLIEKEASGLKLKASTYGEDWLLDKKFGAMLSVGQGSSSKSCLVVLDHNPISYKKKILLVGKGITFDSGGINLKPGNSLEGMKSDMAGAAVVAGVMLAVEEIKTNNRVIGVIPLVENMPSGNAICPGDVVKSYSGKSIEIKNTDAEGRLILADSLAWGISKYNPDFVIDIATLTGACVVALGENMAGLFSNDTNLSKLILKSSEETSEHCWRMPLYEGYRELLKSDIADLSNVSESKGAGAITAAIFLSEFIQNLPWAHIDIAGTTKLSKKNDYTPIGASGFGVRLISRLIEKL